MSTDATQVTGSGADEEAPRPGDVLAERYELLEAVDLEGPVISYRALDQESERPVLVRVLGPEVMPEDECAEVVERLKRLIGIGGRYLGSLLDADEEQGLPFTVEAWPRGTQLSAILAARRSRSEALGPAETLPVVAQLAAALQALPAPLCHGDVRAERVWLDTDGLRLTGAHLLAALTREDLEARVTELGPGALAYAPEVAEGDVSTASDRWGVASIAWEALTGRSPDPEAETPELDESLRGALIALLSTDAGARPEDLDALISALSSSAGLSAPRLDPEAYRPPTAELGAPPKPPAPKPPRPPRRKIPGAAAEGTQEVSLDQIIEEGEAPPPKGKKKRPAREVSVDSLDPRLVRAALGVSLESDSAEVALEDPNDTAKHDAISVEEAVIATESAARGPDSLDPRLVRAALDVELDSEEVADASKAPPEKKPKGREPSLDGLDPRLVRAALGVTLEESSESGIEELDSDELQAEDTGVTGAEARPGPAARKVAPRPPGAATPSGPPKPFPAPRPSAGEAAKAGAAPKALPPGPPKALLPKAGPPKPGAPKAGPPKAGPPQPGAPKAGPPKPGAPKAGPPKPGAPEAGPPKAGPPKAGPPKAGPPKGAPSASGALHAGAPPASVPSQPSPAPRAPAPAPAAPSPVPPGAHAAAVSPAPAPRAPSPAPGSAGPASKPGHAVPISAPAAQPTQQSPQSTQRPTQPPPRSRPSRHSGGSLAGIVIILVALILAVLIIGIGFLVASQRSAEIDRERIDQQVQQINRTRQP